MQSPSLETSVPEVSAVRVWLSPNTLSVAIPDWTAPVSAQLKLTITLWFVQVPARYAELSALAALELIVGLIVSMRTVVEWAVSLLRALSIE